MAATLSGNPQVPVESRSARKKKAKAEGSTVSPAPENERQDSSAGLDHDGKLGSSDAGGYENPYIKELHKQMRNVTKKLNATQRVDKIIEENADKSLDELVTAKLINTDQKAQALKKPALQSQLTTLEDQLSHYKKFDAEYQDAMAKERELLKSSHGKELEEMRDAVSKEVRVEMEHEFKLKMLTFGRFLKAAAARRQEEEVAQDDDGKAFEGVLSNVYTGDATAVDAVEKLINGSREKVRDYAGDLDVTYARVKELSLLETPLPSEDPWSDSPGIPSGEPDAQPAAHSDPTITHATLIELGAIKTSVPNGTSNIDTPSAPPTSTIQDGLANAAAEDQWDTKIPGETSGMDESYEIIPRDPAETENKEGHTPALATSMQSWADDLPTGDEATVGVTRGPNPAMNGNDGFHEVHHGHRGPRGRGLGGGDRGRGRGRGEFRGGRGRGEFRGGRGRGRGGPRGGRGD